MGPYSKDLRVLFVRYLDAGMSARAAGAVVGVSAATAVRWSQRWRDRGHVDPDKMGGTKPRLLESERDWLVERIERDKNLTLHELLEALRTERGIVVCCDTLWRFLKHCGKSFKKRRSTPPSKAARMSRAGSSAGSGSSVG
jgi:transposase